MDGRIGGLYPSTLFVFGSLRSKSLLGSCTSRGKPKKQIQILLNGRTKLTVYALALHFLPQNHDNRTPTPRPGKQDSDFLAQNSNIVGTELSAGTKELIITQFLKEATWEVRIEMNKALYLSMLN